MHASDWLVVVILAMKRRYSCCTVKVLTKVL